MRPAGAALLLGLLLAAGLALTVGPPPAAGGIEGPPSPALAGPPPPSWPPPPPPTDATAWVLADARTGQLLAGRDVDRPRPVASTVKVLTALTVTQRSDLDDEVTVGAEVDGVGGALVGLRPGDVWTVEQLLDGLLARSGNDAAEALAVHVAGSTEAFVELMRADAARLGAEDVVLTSPSGLDDGNRLSPAALVTIGRAALADEQLRPLLGRAVVDLPGLGEVATRNELLTTYPDAIGMKTGFTSAAGNSLVAAAERDGRELVAVLLDAGEDPVRFEDAARLLDHGFTAFEERRLGVERHLAVGGGAVVDRLDPAPVVVPTAVPSRVTVDIPAFVPAEPGPALLEAGGEVVGELAILPERHRHGPDPGEGAAALGAAVADGVYVALRASTSAGVLR